MYSDNISDIYLCIFSVGTPAIPEEKLKHEVQGEKKKSILAPDMRTLLWQLQDARMIQDLKWRCWTMVGLSDERGPPDLMAGGDSPRPYQNWARVH